MPDKEQDHTTRSFNKETTPRGRDGKSLELTSGELDPQLLDQMGGTFEQVARELGMAPKLELISAAFHYSLGGLVNRVDGAESYLGEEAELLELLQRAPRTLWHRVQQVEKRLRKIYESLDLLLKKPVQALRTIGAVELHKYTSNTEGLDEVALGIKLGDVSRRAHDVRNSLIPLIGNLSLLGFRLRKDQALPVARRTVVPGDIQKLTVLTSPALRMIKTILNREESKNLSLADLVQALKLHVNAYGVVLEAPFNEPGVKALSTGSDLALSTEDLYRLLFNLVDNAKKHGGAKKVSLTVTRKGNSVEIRLKDDGTGFSRDPFGVQASDGHGYGVQGCRTICEAAGGTLSTGPIGEPGAEWAIVLPLKTSAIQR